MEDNQLKDFMQKGEETWFTLDNLSKNTKVDAASIQNLIKNSKLFVQSSSSNNDGQPLYATKDEFQLKSSFYNKLVGAFKNRID